MGQLVYLPALSLGDVTNSKFADALMRDKGIRHNFLQKEKTAYYYPYMLISAHYGLSEPKMREKYDLKDVFILGDSGGFQNVTLNANLDPLRVLRWQEENCSRGLMLDVPPFEATNGAAFGKTTMKVFQSSLEKSYDNALIALRNKQSSTFELLGVVQGDTYDKKIEWFKKMQEAEQVAGKEFEGWALSPKPSNDIREIAQHFIIMKDFKIDKPLHILQVTGFEGLALVAYMTTLHNKDITVDSSTFSYGRRFFMYKSPFDAKTVYHMGRTKDNQLTELPCNCPICDISTMNDLTEERELGEKTVPGVLISLHNMYQTIRYVKFLNALKTDKKLFEEFCQEQFGKDFIEILDYIDDALVIGHEKSWRKHILKSYNLNAYFAIPEVPTKEEVVEEFQKFEDKEVEKFIEEAEKIVDERSRLSEIFDEFGQVGIDTAKKLWEHKHGEKW